MCHKSMLQNLCFVVKASHLPSASLLQPLSIPAWKWEDIGMDFIVGLPCTSQGYDSIWVIVDRLTKSAHFLPVKTTYTVKKYAKLYLQRIVYLHGVPNTIISDKGSQFVSRFWEHFRVPWAPNSSAVLLSTLRPMARQKESIRYSRICSEQQSRTLTRVGTSACH